MLLCLYMHQFLQLVMILRGVHAENKFISCGPDDVPQYHVYKKKITELSKSFINFPQCRD